MAGVAILRNEAIFRQALPITHSNINIRRGRKVVILAARQHESGAFFRAVCGDPKHRAQTGSGPLGAKGSLHIG